MCTFLDYLDTCFILYAVTNDSQPTLNTVCLRTNLDST